MSGFSKLSAVPLATELVELKHAHTPMTMLRATKNLNKKNLVSFLAVVREIELITGSAWALALVDG